MEKNFINKKTKDSFPSLLASVPSKTTRVTHKIGQKDIDDTSFQQLILADIGNQNFASKRCVIATVDGGKIRYQYHPFHGESLKKF